MFQKVNDKCPISFMWWNNSCKEFHRWGQTFMKTRTSFCCTYAYSVDWKFLLQKGSTEINHPPDSPHSALADLFLFLKLKITMKGKLFDTIQNIQKNVSDYLKKITLVEFQGCFQWFKEKCNICIRVPWGLFWMIFIIISFPELLLSSLQFLP